MSLIRKLGQMASSIIRSRPALRKALIYLALDPSILQTLTRNKRFKRHISEDQNLALNLLEALNETKDLPTLLVEEQETGRSLLGKILSSDILEKLGGDSPGLERKLLRYFGHPERISRSMEDKHFRNLVEAYIETHLNSKIIRAALLDERACEVELPGARYKGFLEAWTSRRSFPNTLVHYLRRPEVVAILQERPLQLLQILRHPEIYATLFAHDDQFNRETVAAQLQFNEIIRWLAPHIRVSDDVDSQLYEVRKGLRSRNNMRKTLYDFLFRDALLQLRPNGFEIPEERSFYTQLREIFDSEDYYFECESESPYILDGGTHMGLGIYYFKTLYPNATVIGFEPMPAIREIACRNMERSGFSDVVIHPFALSDVDGEMCFHTRPDDTMANSLTSRKRPADDSIEDITVPVRRLSPFIDRPVHFLKLDIEGSEDLVLEECRTVLYRVQHLFCEYHHGGGLDTDRLAKILHLLDDQGFDVQVGKSWSFQQSTHHRPMLSIDKPYSALIWARNRSWPPAEL